MSLGAFSYDENKDGSCEISYEDYGEYSGMDYEANYKLDSMNRTLLEDTLKAEGCTGSLSEMLREKFGVHLEKCSFASYLAKHDIDYDLFTWCS